jgi:hypothetical protein
LFDKHAKNLGNHTLVQKLLFDHTFANHRHVQITVTRGVGGQLLFSTDKRTMFKGLEEEYSVWVRHVVDTVIEHDDLIPTHQMGSATHHLHAH